jgi:hypothetical protein
MAPIDPTSQMPIMNLAFAHKRVEVLGEAIEAKHSVNDRKRDSLFCGHGTLPVGVSGREASRPLAHGTAGAIEPLCAGALSQPAGSASCKATPGCACHVRWTIHRDRYDAGGQDDGNHCRRVSDDGLVCHGTHSSPALRQTHPGEYQARRALSCPSALELTVSSRILHQAAEVLCVRWEWACTWTFGKIPGLAIRSIEHHCRVLIIAGSRWVRQARKILIRAARTA